MHSATLTAPLWYAQGLRWIGTQLLAWSDFLETRSISRPSYAERPFMTDECRRAEERLANLRHWASVEAASRHLPFPGEDRGRW